MTLLRVRWPRSKYPLCVNLRPSTTPSGHNASDSISVNHEKENDTGISTFHGISIDLSSEDEDALDSGPSTPDHGDCSWGPQRKYIQLNHSARLVRMHD
jgi:hypothetical protein